MGLGKDYGFGCGLVTCNYASITVITMAKTCNIPNKDTKLKCYQQF